MKYLQDIVTRPRLRPWEFAQIKDRVSFDITALQNYQNVGKYLSRRMGKPTICIGKNKGEADQRLCFRYTDSTIPLLSKSKISSL